MAKKPASKKAARHALKHVTSKRTKKAAKKAAAKAVAPPKAMGANVAGVVGGQEPTPEMFADLAAVLDKHKWVGTAAVVRPLELAGAAQDCPPGKCPVEVAIPGPGGNVVIIRTCKPC